MILLLKFLLWPVSPHPYKIIMKIIYLYILIFRPGMEGWRWRIQNLLVTIICFVCSALKFHKNLLVLFPVCGDHVCPSVCLWPWIRNWPLCQVFMKFGVEVLYTKLSIKHEFCGNQLRDIRTWCGDVNECQSLLFVYLDQSGWNSRWEMSAWRCRWFL